MSTRAGTLAARVRRGPSCAVAVGWTLVAVGVTRRRLERHGLQARSVPSGWVPGNGGAGVLAVLRRLEPTCLERSLVLQRWMADHGRATDVVIGVRRDGAEGVKAHAWLDAEAAIDATPMAAYDDLLRLAPDR